MPLETSVPPRLAARALPVAAQTAAPAQAFPCTSLPRAMGIVSLSAAAGSARRRSRKGKAADASGGRRQGGQWATHMYVSRETTQRVHAFGRSVARMRRRRRRFVPGFSAGATRYGLSLDTGGEAWVHAPMPMPVHVSIDSTTTSGCGLARDKSALRTRLLSVCVYFTQDAR